MQTVVIHDFFLKMKEISPLIMLGTSELMVHLKKREDIEELFAAHCQDVRLHLGYTKLAFPSLVRGSVVSET